MRRFVHALAGMAALCILPLEAQAETKTFVSPKFGGNMLDWCMNWGTGCGTEAATAWCKTEGFDVATDASQAVDIGASTPTKLIATGEVCDQSYCDGFASVTCATVAAPPPKPVEATPEPVPTEMEAPAAEAAEETFKNPLFNDTRLSWCYDGSTGCGKQAADVWCTQKEFSTATNFKYVSGVKPTIQIGTGKSTRTAGKAFSRITCVK
jgi:hypothetical protein